MARDITVSGRGMVLCRAQPVQRSLSHRGNPRIAGLRRSPISSRLILRRRSSR